MKEFIYMFLTPVIVIFTIQFFTVVFLKKDKNKILFSILISLSLIFMGFYGFFIFNENSGWLQIFNVLSLFLIIISLLIFIPIFVWFFEMKSKFLTVLKWLFGIFIFLFFLLLLSALVLKNHDINKS